jgi:hypothetical protein
VIAGRTRFYVVAGITGLILGEVLAAATLLGLVKFVSFPVMVRHPFLGSPLLGSALSVAGAVGGTWGGVQVMRWWYRREAARKTTPARQP